MSTTKTPPAHRIKVAEELVSLFEKAGDVSRLALARLIEVRLSEPQAFVTVVGETSTGKSTLINTLIGRPLLPVNAAPSTATVTQVICHEEANDDFLAVYRDATQDRVTITEFTKLTLNPSSELLRLQLFVRPARDGWIGLQVFDTPGYNSLLVNHEEVLRKFLPESDVIVFVAGYKTGFGQVDQDLLELVAAAVADDPSIPVILAINRVPPSCPPGDRRIAEIVANACDCLSRAPILVLIESAPLQAPTEVGARMPNAELLWQTVSELVGTADCKAAVDDKLTSILQHLIRDALADLERQEYELAANDAERAQALAQIAHLREARHSCRTAVRRSSVRLEKALPEIIRSGCETLKKQMISSIDESNKWLGSDDSAHWIGVHELPFGVRRLGREVEYQVRTELELLDRELKEIANTAVQRVRRDIGIKSDASERFTENLVREVIERVGGAAIKDLLHGMGGIGGAAAGAGNLVKMVVSKAGNIIGKTFSREIYDSIGRTFTKKMVGRLAIVTQVIIDVGLYLNHVRRWQEELKNKALASLDEWRDDTIREVLNHHIPDIEERNLRGVNDIYDDLISAKKNATNLTSVEIDRRLLVLRSLADNLRCLDRQL
jgi:GTPase SAR1 family protein